MFRAELHVVELGVGARDVPERRMLRDVLGDGHAVDDDVRTHGVQLFEVLLAGAYAHWPALDI